MNRELHRTPFIIEDTGKKTLERRHSQISCAAVATESNKQTYVRKPMFDTSIILGYFLPKKF